MFIFAFDFLYTPYFDYSFSLNFSYDYLTVL